MNILADSSGGLSSIIPDAPTGSLLWYLLLAGAVQWILVLGLIIKAIRTAAEHRRVLVSAAAYTYEARDQEPYTVGPAAGMFLAIFLVGIVSALITLNSTDSTQVFRVSESLQALVIFAIAVLAWRDVLPPLREFGTWPWYLIAALASGMTFLFATVWNRLLNIWLGTKTVPLSTDLHQMGIDFLTIYLVMAILTPALEELAIRGVILGGLRRALGDNQAIVASAMMFAIMHVSVIGTPSFLFMGLLLGFLRVRSGSLWPCVLMHAMHNSFCFIAERHGF